jgi:hypothetical protein
MNKIKSKDIQDKILDRFFDDFLKTFEKDNQKISIGKINSLSELNIIYFSNNNDDILISNLKEENKDIYEDLKKAYKRLKNTYFYTPNNKMAQRFFYFLVQKENIEEFWNMLELQQKITLFDILISKMNGERAIPIIDLIKPEEYSKLFRLIFERESIYLDKEPKTFVQKIQAIQNFLSEDKMIILMNNIYENSNNLEKNVITSFVKDPDSVLFKNIKNKLDFKFIIEKDRMNNITEELNELFEINKVFLHESKFIYCFNKKIIEKLFNELIPKETIHQIFKYLYSRFMFEDKEIKISYELNEYSNLINLSSKDNYIMNMKVLSKDLMSESEKNEWDEMGKKWLLKVINEDLFKFLSADKSNYKEIGEIRAFEIMNTIKKEIRQNTLIEKIENKDVKSQQRKKI